jgi:hypothetical protein
MAVEFTYWSDLYPHEFERLPMLLALLLFCVVPFVVVTWVFSSGIPPGKRHALFVPCMALYAYGTMVLMALLVDLYANGFLFEFPLTWYGSMIVLFLWTLFRLRRGLQTPILANILLATAFMLIAASESLLFWL